MKSKWIVGVGLVVGLTACASNPHNVAPDRVARVTGKRAIVHTNMRMREFVYFTQLNKLDLTDRWGDFPHKLEVPGGMNSLMIACEWYGELNREVVIKSVATVKHKFTAGHEYEVTSRPAEGRTCVTTITDLTAQERQAELDQARAEAEPKAKPKKSSTTTSKTKPEKSSKKTSKRKSTKRKSKRSE
jgi:hypothetical protein